jgi:type IV fimbrial biogenesis protein FimT
MQGFPRARQAGFSLIDQIMTIAILAVLTGISLPPLSGLVRRQRLQSAQFEYLAAMQYARGVAVSEGVRTIVCPSHDGRHCDKGTDWGSGWLVGRDRDGDGQPDGEPLRTGLAMDASLTVLGSASRPRVRFQSSGSAAGSDLTLLFCLRDDPTHALTVVVSNPGRVRGALADATQAATCAAAK